jgi:hypothetical protein
MNSATYVLTVTMGKGQLARECEPIPCDRVTFQKSRVRLHDMIIFRQEPQ